MLILTLVFSGRHSGFACACDAGVHGVEKEEGEVGEGDGIKVHSDRG